MLRRLFYLIYTLGGLKVEGIIFGAGNLGKGLKRGLEKHYDIHICAMTMIKISGEGYWIIF